MVRAAVVGANGYAGMVLVQLLARHPEVELVQLTSRSYAGRPYRDVFPLLDLEGVFTQDLEEPVDVVFTCLPHNVGAGMARSWLEAGARVVDMSADFRLRDPAEYPRWYKQDHPVPDLLREAVLGLPELHGDEIPAARLIAVPGCYSTAAILALAPAVRSGLAGTDIVVDAKSGVSGAGRSPGLGAHFSEVNESVHAYAVSGHRHLAELRQELDGARITFVPHLIPMTRGILVTCYFDLAGPVEQLREAYTEFYAGQPFTKVVDSPPATKHTAGTNLCLVNVSSQDGKAVVTAALDNLVKGASGQGVECFNLAFGFERTTALEAPPRWP